MHRRDRRDRRRTERDTPRRPREDSDRERERPSAAPSEPAREAPKRRRAARDWFEDTMPPRPGALLPRRLRDAIALLGHEGAARAILRASGLRSGDPATR